MKTNDLQVHGYVKWCNTDMIYAIPLRVVLSYTAAIGTFHVNPRFHTLSCVKHWTDTENFNLNMAAEGLEFAALIPDSTRQ